MTRSVQKIALDKITWPGQVREGHDDGDVASMAAALSACGQLYPILVRQAGEEFHGIDGQTRWLAAAQLGWTTILAIVDDAELAHGDALHRALVANCARADLKPMEKARGIERLMKHTGWPASEAARRLGMSNGSVTRLLALLELPEPIAEQVESGAIGMSAGYELSRVGEPGRQAELAAAVANAELSRDELVQEVASQKKGRKGRKRSGDIKATISLEGGRSVTVSAPQLSIRVVIECLKQTLDKAEEIEARGGDVDSLVRECREVAKGTRIA